MKLLTTKLLLLLAVFSCYAQPKGKIVKIDGFKSKFVQARNIEIWLPAEYTSNPKQVFPVLYMQDGQNVFNPLTSMRKTAWEADETASKLIAINRIEPMIIVAIWSSDKRYMEYFPEKAAKNFTKTDKEVFSKSKEQSKITGNDFLGDEYLKFITEELKPYIDKQYRTKPDKENTSICGSSMGALISLYAICEYPEVFGQAACLSTHWPLLLDSNHTGPSEALKKYLYEKLPSSKDHRIYFDYGTLTLDQYYEPHQKTIDNMMVAKGYTDKNWKTKKFEGAAHVEKAWQDRFNQILIFLYTKESKGPKKTIKPNPSRASRQ